MARTRGVTAQTATGNGTRNIRRANLSTGLDAVFCVLLFLIPLVTASAATVLPGLRAPLLSTPATPSAFRSSLGGSSGTGPALNDVEIQELARGLKYDAGLMYKFVHDHIHFDPTWGDVKGPYMTWMDRSGNAFDQASLMIALLTEAAANGQNITNIKYVVGEIQLTAAQFTSWFGLPDNAEIANAALARAGLYAVVEANEDGTINHVHLEHFWVKATVGGQACEFDPSFKTHTVKERHGDLGIEVYYGLLPGDPNLHGDPNLYADGMDGADDSNGLKDVNKTKIAQALTSYSGHLVSHLKSYHNDANMADVIGGNLIVPVDQTEKPPTALSCTVISRDEEFTTSAVRYMLRTTLRLQHCGIDYTFYSSDIYGRRLILQYNGSNQPQLILDGGSALATGTATTIGQSYDVILSVDHPYSAADFDESVTIKVVSGGFYQILNGWGDTGTEILKTHRGLLEQYRFDGQSDASEPVLGESFHILGLTWLTQTSKLRAMTGGINYSMMVNHHMVGIAGQTSSSTAPYIDVPLGCLGVTCHHVWEGDRLTEEKAGFLTYGGFASGYQHEVIRQLQDCNAVSAVRLMDIANARSSYDRIFYAYDSAGWTTLQSNLHNYSQAEKDQISAYVTAGFVVTLPEEGDLTEQNWTGMGFRATKITATSMEVSYILGGSYGGGSASTNSALAVATLYDNGYGSNLSDSGDGAYTTSATDISIGSGSYPFGLSFGRQYSSKRKLQDGPLGLGWTSSLDVTALVKSDSFKFLGASTPAEAAPQIAAVYAICQLYYWYYGTSGVDTIAALSQSWMMDQMIDKTVVITQGTGKTVFTLDPNGTYLPPSGASLKLVDNNGTFRMKNSSGIFNDFDSNGRLSEWSDAHGNKVQFTYTNGKLTQVAGKIGGSVTSRTLSFTYTGDHITQVTDSAGRSVSYGYTGNELTSFTNLDGNDVTYEYDPTSAGQLAKIFSPIDANTPVVAITYDALGRMMRQTDANDCVWDFYLTPYRTETAPPAQTDPNGLTKRFSTIRWGNPDTHQTISIDAMGRKTTSTYDGLMRVESMVSASGVSSEVTYDQNNNVTGVTTSPVSGSEEDSLSVHGDYEDYVTADGRWFNVKSTSTDAAGNVTRSEYDFDPNFPNDPNVGNLMRVTHPYVDPPADVNRAVETYTYYSDGQVHTTTDALGTITHYEYDTAANGATLKKVTVDANGLSITTEYTYDGVGRVLTTKDPLGNVSQTQYFNSGLTRKTITPPPLSYETIYEYYADGKLKHTMTYVPDTSAPPGSNDFSNDPNCVALWRLEDGALTTDSQGSHTLSNTGVASDTAGYKEGAASGNYDDGDYLEIANSSLSSSFPFKNGGDERNVSVCMWVKLDSLPTQVGEYGYKVLFSKDSACWPDFKQGISIDVIKYGDYSYFSLQVTHGSFYHYSHSSAITTGRWYHLAVTYDDSTKAYRLRVWDDTAQSILGTDATGTTAYNVTINWAPVRLGANWSGTRTFDGRLDEVVVFNDILSTSQIDQIRSNTYDTTPARKLVYLQSITYNSRGLKETVRGPYPENPTADELQVNYTQYAYDSLGRLWKVTDAEDHVTQTRYFPDGKAWKTIDAEGHDVATNTYNDDGSLQHIQDAKGNVTQYEYNGYMKVKKTTFEDDTYEEFAYDSLQRLVGKHTRNGGQISTTYDDLGRVKTKEVRTPQNVVENTVTYTYDIVGKMTAVADNTGATTYSYDDIGRLASVAYPGSKTVSYQYDAAGRRTRLTYPDNSYVTYEYDCLGRLTVIRNSSGTALASYTYDALSRRTDLTYANGTSITYDYDVAGRLLDVNNVMVSAFQNYGYDYDFVGNRTTMTVKNNVGVRVHAYTYDNIYQITDVNYPEDFSYLATDTTFHYDAVGNRTSVVDDSGTASYTTNSLNQYTDVADVNYTYDLAGNMTYDGSNSYTYDTENRLIRVVKALDPLSAACDTPLAFTTGGDAEWFKETTVYEPGGSDCDAAQSGAIGNNQTSWMETTVTGPGTISFYYQVSCGEGDYFTFYIDGQQRYGASRISPNWPTLSYTITDSNSHTFRWEYSKGTGDPGGDDCIRVDRVSWTGAPGPGAAEWLEVDYTYDPSGRRIAKAFDGVVTHKYVYDGDNLIAEYDSSDTLVRKFIHGPCIDEPISMIDVQNVSAVYYYHYDALGSVVSLSDSGGACVETCEYSVFGEVAAGDPTNPNPFTFTGREFDKETGLYFYRARYYNPAIGRFLQIDPAGQGMNWYAYCGNGAVNATDPSGMASNFAFSSYKDSEICPRYFMRFSWTNDDGSADYLDFGSVDGWIQWAMAGGNVRRQVSGLNYEDCGNLFGDGSTFAASPSGWHLADIVGDDNTRESGKYCYWALQALKIMDSTFSAVVDALDKTNVSIQAVSASTYNTTMESYNVDSHTIIWNINAHCIAGVSANWSQTDPLAVLAHELGHAYDDVITRGDPYYGDAYPMTPTQRAESEYPAMTFENRIRERLFRVDPTCREVFPRPGYQECYQVPAATAEEAWKAWDGQVHYTNYY